MMFAWLFVALQFLLPKHLLTAFVWRVARVRNVAVKNLLIERFVASFDVNIDDVKLKVPDDFATFNDFFVRELEDNARPIDARADRIVSPVDGTVSVANSITERSIFQAKGLDYSLEELLATDLHEADAYVGGKFATIYLAPYNYHRIHAPLNGRLVAARYVPGDLFSVNEATVARVNGLFRRNERLIMHFETAIGVAAVIFVGALNVGSISTPWTGEIRPRKSGVVDALNLEGHTTDIKKGDLLGWFNMGSTVILLTPRDCCQWNDELIPGQTVEVGQAIGQMTTPQGD